MAYHWVFTHDIHRLNLPFRRCIHHLNDSQPDLIWTLCLPCLFKFLSRCLVTYMLVSSVKIGQGSHITCSLDILVASQRVYTGTFFAYMTTKHSQVSQVHHIIRAGYMLRDAHAIYNGCPLSFGIQPSCGSEVISRNSCNLLYIVWGIFLEVCPHLIKAFSPFFNEARVMQLFLYYHAH